MAGNLSLLLERALEMLGCARTREKEAQKEASVDSESKKLEQAAAWKERLESFRKEFLESDQFHKMIGHLFNMHDLDKSGYVSIEEMIEVNRLLDECKEGVELPPEEKKEITEIFMEYAGRCKTDGQPVRHGEGVHSVLIRGHLFEPVPTNLCANTRCLALLISVSLFFLSFSAMPNPRLPCICAHNTAHARMRRPISSARLLLISHSFRPTAARARRRAPRSSEPKLDLKP